MGMYKGLFNVPVAKKRFFEIECFLIWTAKLYLDGLLMRNWCAKEASCQVPCEHFQVPKLQ